MIDKLPFFVPKDTIKNQLKKIQGQTSFLLDWEGDPAHPFAFKEKKSTYVFVVDRKGCLRWKLSATFSSATMKMLKETVEHCLAT